ncbi:MAG: hypothetical protein ACYDH3_07280 [Candidatus Aminicenantales bacterium]
MKRAAFLILLLLAAVSVLPAETRLSLNLSGGINYAAGGDFSRGLNGNNSFIQS